MKNKIYKRIFIAFAVIIGLLYSTAIAANAQPPVAYWKADGNANDSIGNNHGTLENGTGFTAGRAGQAFNFDGVDDFVQLPGSWGGEQEATISAWVKTAATNNTFQAVVSSTNSGEFIHFQLAEPNVGGNIVVYTDSGIVSFPTIPQSPVGVWRHIAITAKSGDSNLYVDGNLFAHSTISFGFIKTTSNLRIGAGFPGRHFNGAIDEVKIYNRALTAAEVAQNSQQYLKVFSPGEYQSYMNAPQVSGDNVILRNTVDNCPSCYHTGVGVVSLPSYQAGDRLQWAVLARTTTSRPTTLNIGVQSGSGDQNNLTTFDQLRVTEHFTWIVSAPVVVDAYKPNAYLIIPAPLGQEIEVKQLVLGDPASVIAHISGSQNPSNLPPCGVVTSDTTLQNDCAAPLIVAADNISVNLNRHRIIGTRTQAGVEIFNRQNVRVKNGFILGCDAGLDVRGGGRHRFELLASVYNTFGARLITSTDNEIRHSNLSRNFYGGAYLTQNSNRNRIHNVINFGSTFDGVVFDFGSSDNAVTNSDISYNGRFGIYFFQGTSSSGSNRNRIESNSVNYNVASGMIPASDNIVRNNEVNANGNYGILVVQNGNQIKSNRMDDNSYTGIAVLGNNNTIELNRANRNGSGGITAGITPEASTANGNIFRSNRAFNNGGFDLADYPPGPCTLNTWLGNRGATLYDGCEGKKDDDDEDD